MNRKPIFDAVRLLLGRGFSTAEVTALDRAIDAALAPAGLRQIGPAGIALIKRFEGCAKKRADGQFNAYPDPGTGPIPGRSVGAQPARGSAPARSGPRRSAMLGWRQTWFATAPMSTAHSAMR